MSMKKMVYELVNPSDAWTFEAPSDLVAWLASLLVGRGKTPARRDGWTSPFYLFGGEPEKDFQEEFGEDLQGAVDRHRDDLIVSLRSFIIRREKAPPGLSGEELAKWNDKHRSSMNDFGGYANDIADAIEKAAKA